MYRNVRIKDLNATSADGSAGGTVPATLALTLGPAATFGAFTPGVAKTYTASTTATVISSAGDATLSAGGPPYLTNGAFTLPQPLQIGGVPKSWSAPTSNEVVPIAPQPGDRRHRRAAHGRLQHDGDLHAEHHSSVNPRGPARAGENVSERPPLGHP